MFFGRMLPVARPSRSGVSEADATRARRGDANSFSRAPAGPTAAFARGLSGGSLMRARRGVLR